MGKYSAEKIINFNFQLEIDRPSTYYNYRFTPSASVSTLHRKPLRLYIIHFFLYPRNFDIMKYARLTASILPLQKHNCGTDEPLLPSSNHLIVRTVNAALSLN